MTFRSARVYDSDLPTDGHRVLVDRLWPRGISKAEAPFDEWWAEVAPSSQLRTAFGHDPDKFDDFAAAYTDELTANPAAVDHLRELAATHGTVILMTATKDPVHNHVRVLLDFLR